MTIDTVNQPSWSPPEDFESVSSKIDGITVFAPRKQVESESAPVTYQCPHCGANTRFDVSAGGVACEYCGYSSAAKTTRVGTQADEHEFALETLSKARQDWGESARETCCEACGAQLVLSKEALTTTCPFCGSNRINLREIPSDLLRPEVLIPFKLQINAVKSKAAEWLGKGWYHPGELAKTAGMDRFTGVYLPFWTFDASIASHWKAEVGYERQERYYDGHAKEWKSRTVIDWRWEDGDVSINVDDLLVSGTSRLSKVILERLNPFHLSDLVKFNPDLLAGWQTQLFDVALPDAWEEGKERMREQAKEACHANIPTSHVRNFSMNADFGNEVWRYILLPVYVATYKFEEKTYQVMVNGQTGSVAGQKPVAWWKVWLAIAAMLLPGLAGGLIGLPLLAAGGIGLVLLVVAAVLLVLGVVFSISLYKQAVASEAS